MQSEGGDAEEIICEENGILISAMLRQYFLGLRTLGQWKHTADHWVSVAQKVQTPITPNMRRDDYFNRTASRSRKREPCSSWSDFLHRRRGLHRRPLDEHHDDDSEVSSEDDDEIGVHEDQMDTDILLLRKFWTRWVRKAGVRAATCDPSRDDEFMVDWTQVIFPVLEDRIVRVDS